MNTHPLIEVICKLLFLTINGIIILFQPLLPALLFVLFLVLTDFFLGSVAALKNKKYNSAKSIRKLYVLVAYLVGILVASSFEHYFKVGDLMFVKAVTIIISASELQSLREKIQMITGIDIFKHLARFMEKKDTENNEQ